MNLDMGTGQKVPQGGKELRGMLTLTEETRSNIQTQTWARTGVALTGAISCIVIGGGSGSGKSTLASRFRNRVPGLGIDVVVPVRIVSRPPRIGETPEENVFMSKEELADLAGQGRLSVWWERDLDSHRTELYGFLRPSGNALPIYSANNALIKKGTRVVPPSFLNQALVLGIAVPSKVRLERLAMRSPDLVARFPEETAKRLEDDSDLLLESCHFVGANDHDDPDYMDRLFSDTVRLINQLI